MAMIFQEPMPALNPVVPVGRQIDEVLCAHTDLDARARKKRILDMMEQVRLPEVERIFASYPHRLSGGQRQRIMIAMALVLEPKLLIADEPTTALDVTTQKQILTLIRDLQRDHGTAVLFIDPTSGGIRLAGREISELSRRLLQPHRKRIQIIFQDPYRSLNPRITVGESIAEGPINYGMPRTEALAKARELLELVDLPADSISRYPHQFSGGQRQRIAIARALALDPDVLVADEAVSALDVSVQAQVLELLDEIQKRLGIALLFITHDLRVAAQICDEVVVMQHGRVVEQGPAAEVLTHPKEAYTRALLEAAPGRGWDFANFRPVSEGVAASA